MFTQIEISEKALKLTQIVMQLATKEWVDPKEIKDVLTLFKLKEDSDKMYFLTSFGVVIRKYPAVIFPTQESRQRLLDAIQSCLDELILFENN